MKMKLLTTLTVAGLMATSLAMPTWAGKLPTDPIGGKPPADTKASFTNFESFKDQILYQRAFEAVLWSVPIVQKLGMRRGTLAIGGDANGDLLEAGKTYSLTVPKDNATQLQFAMRYIF